MSYIKSMLVCLMILLVNRISWIWSMAADESHESAIHKRDVSDNNNEEDDKRTVSNIENAEPQKPTYPKRVFLIIGNEFCERFNYFGMSAILIFYLKDKLDLTENNATVIYHAFLMMICFTCTLGAIISDVWLGKFRTILYFSILYVIGSIIVSIGAIPGIRISPEIALYIGLTLIAFGAGGIKPCVSPFGGDQFKLPEQSAQLTTYFSMFYFAFYASALISSSITPILRSDVHCFGSNDCYSLAFGVPALLMIISILLFVIGKSSYTYVKTSSESMLVKMFKCIWNAVVIKSREGISKPHENLLDYSIEMYGAQLVHDTRIMLKILVLYLPLSFFWALLLQIGSRWTLMASKMNGDLGFYTIKADQMQSINSLLTFAITPLFEIAIYPLLGKIGIGRPLQKLTCGGTLAGISFMVSACLQYWIDTMPINSIHMLWQIPQYVILSMGEVIFSITGLLFSYEQAPESMKSVVLSIWYLQVAIGNIILMFIAGVELFDSRFHELLFFSGLMFSGMFVFAILANNYEKFRKTEVFQS